MPVRFYVLTSSQASASWVALLTAETFCLQTLCLCMQVKEFDKPSTLLADSGSMFNKLVEDTGPVASAMLRQMAAAGPQDGPHEPSSSRASAAGGREDRISSESGSGLRGSVELPLPPAAK